LIDQPVSGSATASKHPFSKATTTDALDPLTLAFDPVTLKITGNGGSPAQSWTVFAPKQEEPWGTYGNNTGLAA